MTDHYTATDVLRDRTPKPLNLQGMPLPEEWDADWKWHGWRITVRQGGLVPMLYGRSYYNIEHNRAVYYPVPVNVVVSYARRAWMFLKWSATGFSAYERGFQDGMYHHAAKQLAKEAREDLDRRVLASAHAALAEDHKP